jgi:hypothetical protein
MVGVLGNYYSINSLDRNFLAFLDPWFNSPSVGKISPAKGRGEIKRSRSFCMIGYDELVRQDDDLCIEGICFTL